MLGALAGGAALVAGVDVDDGGAGLRGARDLLGDLVGGQREMRLLVSRQLASDGSDRDHHRIHPWIIGRERGP